MAVWLINPQGPAARPGPRPLVGEASAPMRTCSAATRARAARPGASTDAATVAAFGSLTRREREVVGAAARGQSNAQIAVGAYLSPTTVETHVNSAMIKLGVQDRAQLVGCASRAGLLG
jgi:DNA-binding NarL/FixJ family response regulator